MLAGALNRRIELQAPATVRSPLNTPIKGWATFATVWAAWLPIGDAERVRAEQTGATVTDRFQIRWTRRLAKLSPLNQVQFNGRPYAIRAVKEMGYREALEITACAQADTAAAS